MTTATTTTEPTGPATPAGVPARSHATLSRLTFGGILRSEWIKIRSLRSTFWCYLFIVIINVGFAALASWLVGAGRGRGPGSALSTAGGPAEAIGIITAGLTLSVLISAVLGALMITGEYGTGMIKSTLTADPRRFGAVFGKVLVFGISSFVIGLVSLVVAALVATPGLNHNNVSFDWSDGQFWLALIGGAGYIALVGLISFGLGAIIRSTAGGIAAGIGLVFILPIIGTIFSALTSVAWITNLIAFLPSNAGGKIYAYGAGTSSVKDGLITLDATQGLLVLLAWAVVLLAIATVTIKRRDA
ncbi:ABC transporter permease subunit [Frondihabitans cladoniiphilus]|uniref:ABC transporter permease n=1 Tax=Frondihabitans cladoniiphilus TaxID=715785 RepID=A0ABP8W2N3_9MICO